MGHVEFLAQHQAQRHIPPTQVGCKEQFTILDINQTRNAQADTQQPQLPGIGKGNCLIDQLFDFGNNSDLWGFQLKFVPVPPEDRGDEVSQDDRYESHTDLDPDDCATIRPQGEGNSGPSDLGFHRIEFVDHAIVDQRRLQYW